MSGARTTPLEHVAQRDVGCPPNSVAYDPIMSSENESEALARGCLEAIGFAVERLPELDTPRADFRAMHDEHSYVIEVKSKSGEAGLRNVGRVEVRPIVRTNVLSGVVRDAARQLAATAASESEYRIAWVDCSGESADVLRDQTVRTLYGMETVHIYDQRMNWMGERSCLYFRRNDFHRCADVDAVILSGAGQWAMFLNEFSSRCDAVSRSPLASAFDAVFDPRAVVADGRFLVCDASSIDRGNEAQVQMYLKQKYDLGGIAPFVEVDYRVRIELPSAADPDEDSAA
jgi:hypothetical protein